MTASQVDRNAEKIAKDLAPYDGWFHDPSTTDDIELAARIMLNSGMRFEDARTAAKLIVSAVRNEYGD